MSSLKLTVGVLLDAATFVPIWVNSSPFAFELNKPRLNDHVAGIFVPLTNLVAWRVSLPLVVPPYAFFAVTLTLALEDDRVPVTELPVAAVPLLFHDNA